MTPLIMERKVITLLSLVVYSSVSLGQVIPLTPVGIQTSHPWPHFTWSPENDLLVSQRPNGCQPKYIIEVSKDRAFSPGRNPLLSIVYCSLIFL